MIVALATWIVGLGHPQLPGATSRATEALWKYRLGSISDNINASDTLAETLRDRDISPNERGFLFTSAALEPWPLRDEVIEAAELFRQPLSQYLREVSNKIVWNGQKSVLREYLHQLGSP